MPEGDLVGVDVAYEDGIGRIVLNRSTALNALDLPMVRTIREALMRWSSQSVRAVVVESATDRAFCAGGDIRQVRENTLSGHLRESDDFFATEYEVNRLLAEYPAPVVALVDGLCMGGGLGLSVHGRFRVVTERASLAMPETGIGFFPDIGASYFLSRLPGGVGSYLGLTGARIGASDALDVGLATHHLSSEAAERLPELLLDDDRPVDTVLRELSVPTTTSPELVEHRSVIDWAFTAPDVATIGSRLAADGGPWATKTLDVLGRLSPQSLALTLDLLMWGRQRSLSECLAAEREAARLVVTSDDFLEGVRAVLVDKDRSPRWGASRYLGMTSDGEVRWDADA